MGRSMFADGRGALGLFVAPADAARAVRALRERGVGEIRTASPAPYPELEAALGRPRSRIGWITFAGAVLGATCAFALTIGTSLDLPLVVGGKPVVSLPPYGIIAFELTVLFGGLSNFAAIAIGSFLARRAEPLPHDDRSSIDRIVVFVPGNVSIDVAAILRANGAEEVRR